MKDVYLVIADTLKSALTRSHSDPLFHLLHLLNLLVEHTDCENAYVFGDHAFLLFRVRIESLDASCFGCEFRGAIVISITANVHPESFSDTPRPTLAHKAYSVSESHLISIKVFHENLCESIVLRLRGSVGDC